MSEQGQTSAEIAPPSRVVQGILVAAICAFAVWATWTVFAGYRLRAGLNERVAGLRLVDELRSGVGELRGHTPADGDAEQLRILDETASAGLPPLVGALADPPGIASADVRALVGDITGELRAARTNPAEAMAALDRVAPALDGLTQALRLQTGAISERLEQLWGGLNLLVLAALVFAWVTLLYANQSRRQQERLSELHAALRRELEARKADLSALEQARDRWDLLSNALADGIWEWSPNGTITVSARFAEMLGEPGLSDLRDGAEWVARIHPEDQEAFSRAFDAHVDGFTPALEVEYRIRHADGRWRWVYCRGLAERDGEGEATRMIGAQTDITHLREGAAAQERVAAIEHVTAVVGIGVLSLRRNHELQSVSEAMHAHARPWGQVAEWWRAMREAVSPPELDPCDDCGANVPVGVSLADVESPHGERRVFELTWVGHDHGLDRDEAPLVVMVKDITEEVELRERDEAARLLLARAAEELRAVLDRVPVGVAILREPVVEYANEALRNLLGGEALVGRPWSELLPGLSARGGVVEVTRPDGRRVAVEASPPVAVTLDGRPAALRVVRDLTERRQMEAQLRLTDRLSSIGAMAAGLSHELNNPLTYVIGNIELVRRAVERRAEDGALDRAALSQRIERAAEGLERVRSIVTELSTFARSDEADLEPVDVNAVIDATLPLVTRLIQPRARLLRDRVEVPRAMASKAWLGQVLLNLLINAAHAIAPGDPGRNTVTLRTGADKAGRVLVEVADTGGGVAPEHRERIFDPFFTTQAAGEGAGLGLFVCQSLAHRMGGEVSLAETSPMGTRMVLRLPAAALAAGTGEVREGLSLPAGSGRVLVIDDEPDVIEIIDQFLPEHVVVGVAGGEAAVDRCREGGWDLIFCDLMMPGLDGMRIFERVKAVNPGMAQRFWFITGGVLNAEVARFLRETDRPHRIKPLDFKELAAIVDREVRAARRSA